MKKILKLLYSGTVHCSFCVKHTKNKLNGQTAKSQPEFWIMSMSKCQKLLTHSQFVKIKLLHH
jgi:hypothetical protein